MSIFVNNKHKLTEDLNSQIDEELQQAQEKLAKIYTQNSEKLKELARLQAEQQKIYEEEKKKIDSLDSSATELLKSGKRDDALRLMRDKLILTEPFVESEKQLMDINEHVEQVKLLVKNQKEQIEKVALQAISLKTTLQATDIQNRITQALSEMTSTFESENFTAGQDTVFIAIAEAAARNEMFIDRLDLRIAAIDEKMALDETERALLELEARMRNSLTDDSSLQTRSPSTSIDPDLDRLLQELTTPDTVGSSPSVGSVSRSTSDDAFLNSLEETINRLG